MTNALEIDLFAEDRGHEEFLRALVHRLAKEADLSVDVRVRSARGGHPRVLKELRFYQKAVEEEFGWLTRPDILVVGSDANCSSHAAAHTAIEGVLTANFKDRTAIACPDPHIERWYLADPTSFGKVIGKTPKVTRRKCDRAVYKDLLARSVIAGGHPAPLGGLEFAREIVDAMDLYRAGKNEKSLKHFLDDLTRLLKR